MDLTILLGFAFLALVIFHAHQMNASRGSLAPWMPSSKKTLKLALTKINAKPEQRFIDLGSGSGNIVRTASKKFGLTAKGVEKAIVPYTLSKLKSLFSKRITFSNTDLYDEPLGNYDIIYIFGLPETVNNRLIEKLNREVKPGAVVISNYFPIHSRTADDIISDKWRRVYIYYW